MCCHGLNILLINDNNDDGDISLGSGSRAPEDVVRQQSEVIDLTDDRDEEEFHHFSLMLDIRSLDVLSTRGKAMQCYVR